MESPIVGKYKKEPEPLDPAVVLTNADLIEISRLLKRNVLDRDDLMAAVKSAATITVEGAEIILEPRLLQRLKTRCNDKGRFHQFLREVIITQLHDFAGW